MESTTYPGSAARDKIASASVVKDLGEVRLHLRPYHHLTSDTEIDCCDKSNVSQELDFVDHWIDLTIEEEVFRGSKLREEKNKICAPQGRDECAVNIDYIKSPCVDYSYFRKRSARNKFKTISCASPRSSSLRRRCSPSHSYNTQALCSIAQGTNSRCLPKCPLRIAELAVPTKRQCIDTWRNKCNVLPSCMVDRLKQQVMDEKPIVHITDAINCFKRRKMATAKSAKRPRRFNHNSKLNDDNRMMELRQLCAIFGNKIALKLITPKNLKLNPELYQISKIVADEVANIMRNRKFDKNNINDKMQAEISEKIAVWVATVLEDTSYKLLEEDLRALKRTERDVKEDGLVTLVKLPLSETELEEEEGPVLDFIDDHIDNVVNVCEPQADAVGDQGEFSEKSISLDNIELDTLYTNIINDTGDAVRALLENEDITDNVEEKLENVTQDQSEELTSNMGLEDQDIDPVEQNIDKIVDFVADEVDVENKLENVTQEQPEVFDPETVNVHELGPIEGDTLDSKSFDPLSDTNPLDVSKAEYDNVSDVFEVFGESNDDKNKKVQFSITDLGVQARIKRLDDNGAQQYKDMNKDGVLSSTNSIDNMNQNIVFAPPNDHLLSIVDESWPKDIATPVIKATASVSRSVTSLGNILEREEKALLSPEYDINVKLDHTQTKLKEAVQESLEDGIEFKSVMSNKVGTAKTESSDELYHESLNDELETAFAIKLNGQDADAVTSKTTDANIKLKVIEVESDFRSTLDIFSETEESIKKHAKSLLVNERDQISHTNIIYEAVQRKLMSSYATSEPKFDYKVDPKTAPAWLKRDHGRGEPSDESFGNRCKPKEKFKESEIRFWCKDLERIFQNLDLWNGWLETTCNSIMYLKQKKDMNKLFAPCASRKDAVEWLTLKKNIDKDAVLWTKLNQRAYERLRSYKERNMFNEDKPKQQAQSSRTNKAIVETMEDIDRMSLWIHRTIVSTEYMMCSCKNNLSGRRKL